MSDKLRIGYIPLVDATTLFVAADQGFAAEQGLDIELVREVSWSNVRDKLNIGLFDAAHLLSPVAIASSLGLGHVRVPLIVPFNLGINGNAITVSPGLFALLSDVSDGDLTDPKASGRALARVIAERKKHGGEPLTFGMTFPFSNHNYQLRFWMAVADIDPEEDVRLVVLPPPYMVESLASGHVDGFCVGAPWNSVAVDSGVGHILHFGCEITAHVSEKVLALREQWAEQNPNMLAALLRALGSASEFAEDANNLSAVANIVADRLGVAPELVVRTLTGTLKIDAEGTVRHSENYISIGRGDVSRPDTVQAAWAYAQIVRWGQAPLSQDLCARAQNVFRPGLYDAVLGSTAEPKLVTPRDGIGAFSGPDFDAHDIGGYVSAWRTKRVYRPRLSVVR
jgi:NitT/TauT family transport system ATP-binding protein